MGSNIAKPNSFIFTELNGSKYYYVTFTIQFNMQLNGQSIPFDL